MDLGKAAAVAQGLGDPDLTDAARVELISMAEDLKNQLAAAQARLTVDLAGSVRARHRDLKVPAAAQGRGVASQVALARRESPAKGSRLLGLATALVGEMPHTLAAMEAGRLSEWRATLVARETACLTVEDRRRVDAELFADPARTDGWGDRRLAAETKKIAYRLDPASVARRSSKAESERRVTMRPAPDTMASLHALLPVAQGRRGLGHSLRDRRHPDRHRRRPHPRPDHGRHLSSNAITGQAVADDVPITVNVTVSDADPPGRRQRPGLAARLRPDPRADRPRPHPAPPTRQASPHSAGSTSPPTPANSSRWTPPPTCSPTASAVFLDLRDQTCRTPWCDAPIRHHDHITARAAGGPTTGPNGQGLCEQCNYAKEAPGWRAHHINGPPGQRHTVETITPTGHRYHSVAPGLPRPSRRPPPRQHRRGSLHQLVLAV